MYVYVVFVRGISKEVLSYKIQHSLQLTNQRQPIKSQKMPLHASSKTFKPKAKRHFFTLERDDENLCLKNNLNLLHIFEIKRP